MDYNYGNSKKQIKRINCLLNYLELNRGASLTNILDHYEFKLDVKINRKNVNRQFSYDKELLKKEGVIIEYNSDIKGYEIIEFPKKSKKMLIPEECINDLPILFSLINTGEHLLSADWLIKELKEKYNVDETLWQNETYFSRNYIQQHNDEIIDLCGKLIKLMKQGQAIEFEYRKVNTNEKNKYIIAPLQIRLSNDSYYLIGCKYINNVLTSNISVFKMDMIENLLVKKVKTRNKNNEEIDLVYNYSKLVKDSDLTNYFKHCLGVYNPNTGGKIVEPKRIRLKFKKWACTQVMKRKIHPTQVIPKGLQTEIVNGKEEIFCIVHLHIYETEELKNLLGRYREDVDKLD
ncbi:MAG: WYL domain-containing protein [Flavobacterium sp.]